MTALFVLLTVYLACGVVAAVLCWRWTGGVRGRTTGDRLLSAVLNGLVWPAVLWRNR